MKIAFFGTPKIAAEILESLAKTKFRPQLVVTGADTQAGRGKKIKSNPTKEIAQKFNIQTIEPGNLNSQKFIAEFKSFEPDVAILVAFGKIIPDKVLTIPKFGFINVHPSLLPKYRGPSPIISAILNGDKTTGATIIALDSDLDHGPIIAQGELPISETDTHDSLATKIANVGSKLIIETLPEYLDQNVTPQAQDHDAATYTEKITKQNGKIDLENPPNPQTLDRMVRAYYPWPTVWTEIEGKRIKLLPNSSIKLSNLPRRQAGYQSNNLFLIQPEGKKPMTIKEFLNGYPHAKKLLEKLLPIH